MRPGGQGADPVASAMSATASETIRRGDICPLGWDAGSSTMEPEVDERRSR
jgi:hypothetical protein